MRRLTNCVLGSLLLAASPLFSQTLDLQFLNSSTWNSDDIWITFESGAGTSTSLPVGDNPGVIATVNGADLGYTYSGTYTYENNGTTATSDQTEYWTDSMTLSQLSGTNVVDISEANSARIYVSLGTPLVFSGSGQDGGLLSAGAPSISNPSDPNYNIRWDNAEITIIPSPGDQGDITAINSIAIPMSMTSYATSGTGSPIQSTQTSTNFNELVANIKAYQTANAANNVTNLPTTYTTGTDNQFIRTLGVTNGAQAQAFTSDNGMGGTLFTSSNAIGATIGANATFGDYVAHMYSGTITTPVAFATADVISSTDYGYTGVISTGSWASGSTLSATWANATGGTSTGLLTSITTGGTGAYVQVGGFFTGSLANSGVTGTLGAFNVIVPPDVTSGGTDNFIQSSVLYAGTAVANFGVIFQYTPTGGTMSTYYNAADFEYAVGNGNSTLGLAEIQQLFHDVAAGFNFGLIGDTNIDPLSGITYNDEGSAGWTLWEQLKNGATVITSTGTWSLVATGTGIQNPGTMPLYANAQSGSDGFYNQYSALVYASSTSAYGNTYSDYLQEVDVNLLHAPLTSGTDQNIDHVTLNILPDGGPVPEPTTASFLLLGLGFSVLGVAISYSRRPRRSQVS